MSISFPAIAVYFAINILIASYSNPVDIDIRGLNKIAIIMFVLFLIQFIISMVTFLRTFLPAAKHSSENKMDFIHKLRKLPLGFFSKKMTGELINNMFDCAIMFKMTFSMFTMGEINMAFSMDLFGRTHV